VINNFWEEQGMDDISSFHEEQLGKMGIPEWAKLECPFCQEKLPLRSIRTIGLKFNTRNMGDLVVEIVCYSCSKGDTLYFRKEIDHIEDFCELLVGNKKPKNNPVIEENMYRMMYNNVVEKKAEVEGLNKDINKEKNDDSL